MTSASNNLRLPNLLVLASTYPRWPGDHEPGFVHELCRRLAGHFRVTVVCPSAKGAARRETMDGVSIVRFRYAPSRFETLVNDGGITTNLRASPWKLILVPLFLLGLLVETYRESRKSQPDVVHAHWLVPQGLIASVSVKRSTPLVVTSHGADLFAWRSRLIEPLKKLVLRRASVVTVVSRAMAKEIDRLGGQSARVFVAPMGVDLTERFIPGSQARSKYEILFVGRMVEKKGLRYLLDAMPSILARFPNATLTVAGFGPEYIERTQQARIRGLEDSVRFLGAVTQQNLPELYRRAAVFVAPFVMANDGDQEGLGLVSLEAAGCGCPVVTSDLPAIHDVFGPDEAVFAKPGDSDAIAQAVCAVLGGDFDQPPGLRASLRSRFDWSSVCTRYRELLINSSENGPQ